jgi:hypothetical protein
MNDWVELQNHFQNYLHLEQPNIIESIVTTEVVSAKTRLHIYRNAYQARLEEALASNFPYLKVCIGDEAFHQMCLDYIASHPSKHRSIRWYGDTLPDFLTHNYDKTCHFLAELARFEWHLTMAFDALDVPVFELAKMASIAADAWGTMTIKVHPSLQRINFFWNVVPLWEALAHAKEPIEMIQSKNASPWALWRHNYLNRFYSLPDDEAFAMDTIITGHSFGALCEGLCQWHDESEVSMRAASLLKSWIQSGLISDILF